MLLKTKGIVVRAIKYSETSIITDIYTEKKGMQSYIISGVRSKKARTKASLLQLMTLVDMVVYHRDDKELTRIKEIKADVVYLSIPFDIIKGAVGLFITEVIQKTVKEQESNLPLFSFLYEYFQHLDTTSHSVANLHLAFMLELSPFLGFMPHGVPCFETPYFDLKEGAFVKTIPDHIHYLNEEESNLFGLLLSIQKETAHQITLSKSQRKFLLRKCIDFYRYHIDNMPEINAHLILEGIF